MATASITVDAVLKARLAALARQARQDVDEFVEALLGLIVKANVRFERGVPVFCRRLVHPHRRLGASTTFYIVGKRERRL